MFVIKYWKIQNTTYAFLLNPFMISLDKCNGSYNTLSELSDRIFIPNKTGDVHLIVFKMITRKQESKTLMKHIS